MPKFKHNYDIDSPLPSRVGDTFNHPHGANIGLNQLPGTYACVAFMREHLKSLNGDEAAELAAVIGKEEGAIKVVEINNMKPVPAPEKPKPKKKKLGCF